MNLLAQLQAQLARYDDEAFAALGNRGLLRRAYKDLDTQVARIEARGDAVIVQLGEQQVRFDARGPAQATCSCPAGGVCQHLLAASIALKRSGEAAASSPEAAQMQGVAVVSTDGATVDGAQIDSMKNRLAQPEAAQADEQGATAPVAGVGIDSDRSDDGVDARADDDKTNALAPLHAALLAFDAPTLRKHAGKAGYRWAWQFVQDLDPEHGVRIDGERHVRIAFAHPRIAFRYMGGGLDALIADASPSPLEKYRVAAVLAYRRAYGAAIEPPEAAPKARAQALDLGKDHALAERGEGARAQAREDARGRLRLRVRQLLLECIELGLSHLSPAIAQRFSTLAVWAQGADDYRLAMLLRRLADHVEWLNERAGGADEHRLCDEIALAYGLTNALEAAAARGAAPVHLTGRARNRYEGGARLELLGLGAHVWRSASGYVGLTMLFWSPGEQAFFSCTDARPEQQRGFDPIARYRAAGPWSGLGAPQQATGRRLVLDGAQLSLQGRLSASEHTTATLQPLAADAFAAQLPIAERWADLAQARFEARRSLLVEAQPMRDWGVLRPARFGDVRFDAARQTLVWPLYDEDGDRLDLELPYSTQTEHAIGRIEAAAAAGIRPETCVVARLRNDSEAVAEPLSLIDPSPHPGQSPVDALYFDPAPAAGALGGVKQAIGQAWKHLRSLSPAAVPAPAASGPVSVLPAPLRELRHTLLAQAERGIGPTAVGATGQAFTARLRRLRDAGFHAFPVTLAAETPLPEHLLRLHYLQLQYARLYDGGSETLEN
jgi:SWIM zinc finger